MVLLLFRNLHWCRSCRRLANDYVGFSLAVSDDRLAPFSPDEGVVTCAFRGVDGQLVVVVVSDGECYG